jgi:hypothetical protein
MKRHVLTHCDGCERNTNQRVFFSKKVKLVDEFDENNIEYFSYMIIECAGCKRVSFLRREQVEDFENPHKTAFIDTHYPKDDFDLYSDFNFIGDEDQEELPSVIYDVYEEVKTAFENDSCILAGIGLRTLVEAICLQQKIPGRTLQDKIKNLHAKGLISSAELPILDKLRLIGNMSTHQIKSFSLDKLNYALDIVNHVLKSIYILPKINRRLKISN